jgi:hypothetical protein
MTAEADRIDERLAAAAIPPLPDGALADDEAAWEARARATIDMISGQNVPISTLTSAEAAALFDPPSLPAEPGEPSFRGASTMSDSDDVPKPSQRRASLKELAERVSKTPPPPSVSQTPPPPSVSQIPAPVSSRGGDAAPMSAARTAMTA